MARRLRLQFAGATYHVINRGNYRSDVFGSAGAGKAFELALDEACQRFHWRLHAYVIMRNHYHLAIRTPEPNLVDGMHWLQSSFATRFNRFRSEHGHVFQGRYQALLIEDAAALARVVNYIHLNPVRAKIVPAAQVALFRWSSLGRFSREIRPTWLDATDWLKQLGHEDSRDGWSRYTASLVESAAAEGPKDQHREFCTGWAIGSHGWRVAVAKDHAHMSLPSVGPAAELRDLKRAQWTDVLEELLRQAGKTLEIAETDPKGADWKRAIAARLRSEAAPHRWIAETLHMGSPNSVRSYVSRDRGYGKSQQLSA